MNFIFFQIQMKQLQINAIRFLTMQDFGDISLSKKFLFSEYFTFSDIAFSMSKNSDFPALINNK